MKFSYFPDQAAQNSAPVLAAVIQSLAAHGHTVHTNAWDADAAIIWSVLWQGRMAKNQQVYQHYRSLDRPVIIVEVGALHRGHTWKVSVNNVTAQGYYGHLDHLDWDRPRRLGIAITKAPVQRPDIVVAAQHIKSLQVANVDINQWISDAVDKLRTCTDRPITLRPHPRSQLISIPAGVKIERPRRVPGTYDSFDLQYNCHAVVNYNSGPGIQAAIAGVRPIVDFTSLAYPVSINFEDIEQPYEIDRDLWITQICHSEYTVEELQQGLWLKRIQMALTAPV